MKEYEDPQYLLEVITEQNKVLADVIAERDDLRQHLENLAPGAPDALACLRRVYNDPKMKEAERVKAAAAAIGYERAKPASVSVVIDFKERVRTARLKQLALDKARWAAEDATKVIEHQPLDLDAPTPPTLLGGDDSARH
jgi:hypothetical protein